MINSSSTVQQFNDSTNNVWLCQSDYCISENKLVNCKKGISVIICCHNSEALIVETVEHLFNQNLTDDLKLEIILVDNSSTDQTIALAGKTAYSYHSSSDQITFHTVAEPKIGLTNARFTGALHATHDILIFCDDDNFLAPEYCATAFQIMQSDPRIGACGGRGEPVFQGAHPDPWFHQLGISLAWGPQADKEGYTKSYTLYGAGLVIRKKVLDRLHTISYQPLLLDRTGKELTSGGDEELTIWCKMMGYQLYYTPRLRFQHYIKKERLSEQYITRLYRGFGITLGRLVPLQIIYFDQENTFKAAWFYQYIRWSLIALQHCLDYSKDTPRRKSDCICNKQRLGTLWKDRKTYSATLQYLIKVKQELTKPATQ